MDRTIETFELSGEGGYEGLRLHLYVEGDGELSERSTVQWGFIYPTDPVVE